MSKIAIESHPIDHRSRLSVGASVGWLATAGLVLLGGLLVGAGSGLVAPVSEWFAAILGGLASIPLWAFMLAFILLPAVGFPLLAFYLSIGAFTEGLGQSLVLAWSCMAGNMAVSYLLARPLAGPLRRIAERRGYRIPRIAPPDDWKIIVMMRASPLPWVIQSYLLALGGAHFWRYMLFGVPVQMLVGLGVILLGTSLLRGDAKWALVALCIMMAASLARSTARRRARTTPESA